MFYILKDTIIAICNYIFGICILLELYNYLTVKSTTFAIIHICIILFICIVELITLLIPDRNRYDVYGINYINNKGKYAHIKCNYDFPKVLNDYIYKNICNPLNMNYKQYCSDKHIDEYKTQLKLVYSKYNSLFIGIRQYLRRIHKDYVEADKYMKPIIERSVLNDKNIISSINKFSKELNSVIYKEARYLADKTNAKKRLYEVTSYKGFVEFKDYDPIQDLVDKYK